MCTCGNTEPHVIAHKTTSDGRPVEIYSDGYVTSKLGYLYPSVGRRRVPQSQLLAFAGDVCIYTAEELGGLVTEHQKAAKAQAKLEARLAPLHPDAIIGSGRPLQYGIGFQGRRS